MCLGRPSSSSSFNWLNYSSSLSLILLPQNNVLRSHIIALKLPLWSQVKKSRALTKMRRRRRANYRKSIINYPISPPGTMSHTDKEQPRKQSPLLCSFLHDCAFSWPELSLNTHWNIWQQSHSGVSKTLSLSETNACVTPSSWRSLNISDDVSTVMWIFWLLKSASCSPVSSQQEGSL